MLFFLLYTQLLIISHGTTVTINAFATKTGKLDSTMLAGEFSIEYIITPPTGLSATSVLFDEVSLAWNSVELADEYVLYRYYWPAPGPPSLFTSFVWTEIYRGTELSFSDDGLWGGRELYYRVESYSAAKGTAMSEYIRVDTPIGEIAFTHNLSGTHSYRDADAYAYRSGSTWIFAADNSLNNQSDTFEDYGHLIAVGSGPTFGDSATLIVLSPDTTDYELTSTSVVLTTFGEVGGRVSGSFSGYYAATPVVGSFSLIRLPDQ
jgi:hypothetical protein